MTAIQWTVDGTDGVLVFAHKLSDFPGAIKPVVNIWGYKMLLYRIKGRVNYPAEPVGSRYKRTGTLGNGWVMVEQGHQMFAFHNPTSYGIYVVGDSEGRGQAWMHKGRWWLAYERIMEGLPGLEGEMEAEAESWYKN